MDAHLLQMDIAWEDPERNFETVRAMLAERPPAAGDLILLPEMFATGFSLNVGVTAAHADETEAFLHDLAVSTRTMVVGGLTRLDPDTGLGHNVAIACGPEAEAPSRYTKIHPFSYGREAERFAGGREVVTLTWSDGGREALTLCPTICYDLRFPELFRAGLDLGAEAFAVIANWPAARAAHWRALLVARAIENQAWVLGVNRSGSDPRLWYAGGSMIIDPRGSIIAEAAEAPVVLSAGIDAASVREWRAEFPAWADRQPDRW